MNWLTIKAKLIGAVAIVLTVAGFLLRMDIVTKQRDKARKKADRATARANEAENIVKIDAEIESEISELERESDRAIESGEMPGNIRNRNQF